MRCKLRGLALVVLGGCGRDASPPPVCVAATHGRVFAQTVEQASALAPDLDRNWEAVRDLVPGCRDVSVDVWVVRELDEAQADFDFTDTSAFSIREPPRIVLSADNQAPREILHELVHVLADDTWSALPAFVFEGMANYAASRLAPRPEGSMSHAVALLPRLPGFRLLLVSTAPDAAASCTVFFGDPALDGPGLQALLAQHTTFTTTDYVDRAGGYALGFVIASRVAERHGLQGLRALCEAARARGAPLVAPGALLEAAELPSDPAGWWPLLLPSLGEAELRTLAHRFAQLVAKVTLNAIPGTRDEIVARAAAGLVELRVGAVGVRLSEVPDVMQELRAMP